MEITNKGGMRWHTREELKGKVSFYCGPDDKFAVDSKRGFWYWTSQGYAYYGPYRKLTQAAREYRAFNE